MRVTLVSPHYPPRYVAGVELHVARLAAWLSGHGHDPEVVCVEGFESAPAATLSVSTDAAAGYPVHRLTLPAGSFRTRYLDSEVRTWLGAHLRSRASDVLHLESGYLLGGSALLAAEEAGTPRVVMLHDYWFACPRVTLTHPSGRLCSGPDHGAKCAWCVNADRRVFHAMDRVTRGAFSRAMARVFQLRALASLAGFETSAADVAERSRLLAAVLARAEIAVAPTEFLARRVASSMNQAVDVRIIRGGLDPLAAPKQVERHERTSGLRVGYLGQVARHKGIDVLVKAVRAVSGVPMTLRIYGDLAREPAHASELRRLTGDDGRIRFMGAYANAEVGDILATVDVLVVPSRWPENYPTVILEAQACGVPVIASRTGGMPEMIRDGTDGVLVEADSVGQLSAALVRCATDPGFLSGLAAAVRPPRSFADEADQWVSVYEEARGGRRSGRQTRASR